MFKPFYVDVAARVKKPVFIAEARYQRPILGMADRKRLPSKRLAFQGFL